jgi:uncharacterized repeat protein (TIGR03803 family)
MLEGFLFMRGNYRAEVTFANSNYSYTLAKTSLHCIFVFFLICILVVPGFSQTLSTLYNFQGGATDGSFPNPDLSARKDGYYGTTRAGGSDDAGTVFHLIPPTEPGGVWTNSLIYSFTGGSDGSVPFFSGVVFDLAGNAYGTTEGGGEFNAGTIFKLTAPKHPGGQWTESVLYSFTGGADGMFPQATLIRDFAGNLYGTAVAGGIPGPGCPPSGCGVIFKISPPRWRHGTAKVSTLYSFTGGADGAAPSGLVFGPHAGIYGTTNFGGAHGLGVVFRLSFVPKHGQWVQTVLYAFETGNRFAGSVQPALIFDRFGALYGTRQTGGDSNLGIAFKLSPPTLASGAWTATILHSFGANGDGINPIGRLTLDHSGSVYGTTLTGGATGRGIIFKLTPPDARSSTWAETIVHTFDGTDGGFASSTLRFDKQGSLYGIASEGGQFNFGTLFRLIP